MRIIGKCQACKKVRLFIRKRVFKTKHAGLVTSQNLLCGKCKRKLKKALRTM